MTIGSNFSKEEKERLERGLTVYSEDNQYYSVQTNGGVTHYRTSDGIAVNENDVSLWEIEQLQATLSEIESSEESSINDEEYGYNLSLIHI